MWIFLGLISALFLGAYDLSKKASLNHNAVLPVLFWSTVFGALPWIPLFILSQTHPAVLMNTPFYVPPMSLLTHGLIFLKSLIVTLSWLFVYFGMKHLPISIAAPIRASAPLWTLLGAVLWMGEHPAGWQWVGLALTLGGYFSLSLVGQREGIVFHKNIWILFMFVGTLIGAGSALYDKFLLNRYPTGLVQPWFSFYLVVILFPVVMFGWWPTRKQTTPFQWRWTIPVIGLSLGIADFLYFQALRYPAALIAILSAIRRSNVIVSFGFGSILFQEQNRLRKAVCLAAILCGVLIIVFAR